MVIRALVILAIISQAIGYQYENDGIPPQLCEFCRWIGDYTCMLRYCQHGRLDAALMLSRQVLSQHPPLLYSYPPPLPPQGSQFQDQTSSPFSRFPTGLCALCRRYRILSCIQRYCLGVPAIPSPGVLPLDVNGSGRSQLTSPFFSVPSQSTSGGSQLSRDFFSNNNFQSAAAFSSAMCAYCRRINDIQCINTHCLGIPPLPPPPPPFPLSSGPSIGSSPMINNEALTIGNIRSVKFSEETKNGYNFCSNNKCLDPGAPRPSKSVY